MESISQLATFKTGIPAKQGHIVGHDSNTLLSTEELHRAACC